MKLRLFSILWVCVILILVFQFSCSEKYPPSPTQNQFQKSASGCVNCHFDKELLQKVATPIEIESESGEG